MDLTFNSEEEAFRAEARAWLSANVPHDLPSGDTREGFARHLDWERKLFDARWAVVSWPREYGGREASLIEWALFEVTHDRAGRDHAARCTVICLLRPPLSSLMSTAPNE